MEGRVAVVTGGARGLGRAIAERFTAEGAAVAVWDLGEADGVALADQVDVSDPAAVEEAATRVRERLGPVAILVNNTGVAEACPPWEVTDSSWQRIMRTNVDGAFWCARACLPDMRAAGHGKIVNVASIAALHGRPSTHPAYAASKAGLLGLTASLSHNLGVDGICVNAICPGFIRTEIHDSFTDAQMESFTADIPLRPHGRGGAGGLPGDVAGAALYLAGPDSDYVTGVFLNVNGGARTG
ncbi:SDR family NAD(P)-dependent oxidoreductase [Pseudonocardia sp. KRD291]|uniref:SDR family NAD(P)-dependent oxidoreductase n=1 Tax=Pseudonocardia sp. KRD291 TaxID=2792007 RepID=UPI001C4A10C0|nr:SDR family oxidoreductase [Pseudonocardia sp. KRD291]MBW0103460.1 SDR family oxidoreductase [Pseudonocardia sp. KRD291]